MWHCFVLALLLALLGPEHLARAQAIHPFPDEIPDFFQQKNYGPPAVQLPDGRSLIPGYSTRGFAVVRTLADASVDRAFGRGGVAELVLWGGGEYIPGPQLAVLADGSAVVAGNVRDGMNVPGCDYVYIDCNVHIVFFRLDADGRQDMSFNGYGRLVLRVGGPTAEGTEDGDERFLYSFVVRPDGSILASSQSGTIAHVLADGRLDLAAPRAAHENDFIAAVPFYNAALDQYFVTADPREIAGLQRPRSNGAKEGWQQSGDGWFHVYPPGWTATPTVPVCRFYGAPEAGLDSHVLSANAEECAALEAAKDRGWILESREVFRVELPDPLTGACANEHAPVFRLWNARVDSGHLLATARSLRDRLVRDGYVAEGWGPLGVAMCAAP